MAGSAIPRVFLWNPSTMFPLPMYACFSMSRRTFNQVPLPLLGPPPVDSPSLTVVALPTALVRALAPVLFSLAATPNWPVPEAFKQRPPSPLCFCSYYCCLYDFTSALPSYNPCLSLWASLLFRDWNTALSEFINPLFICSCTKRCGEEGGRGSKDAQNASVENPEVVANGRE